MRTPLKSNFYIIIAVVLLALLNACATLNKEECLAADWKTIGYSDGSKGYKNNEINKHRKACAEYKVTPDLDRYMEGHASGLKSYCTLGNGLTLGKRGRHYNGVCPSNLSAGFIRGYEHGKNIYNKKKEIKSAKKDIKNNKKKVAKIKATIRSKEATVVGNKASAVTKMQYLEDIKEHSKEVGRLNEKTIRLDKNISVLETELRTLNSKKIK